jgi:hypothetical protein
MVAQRIERFDFGKLAAMLARFVIHRTAPSFSMITERQWSNESSSDYAGSSMFQFLNTHSCGFASLSHRSRTSNRLLTLLMLNDAIFK